MAAGIEYDFAGKEIRRFQTGYSTAIMGDAQRLPGGNTLLTFSAASMIQEFDGDGKVVFEIDGGDQVLGYSTWRPTLYGPPSSIVL